MVGNVDFQSDVTSLHRNGFYVTSDAAFRDGKSIAVVECHFQGDMKMIADMVNLAVLPRQARTGQEDIRNWRKLDACRCCPIRGPEVPPIPLEVNGLMEVL